MISPSQYRLFQYSFNAYFLHTLCVNNFHNKNILLHPSLSRCMLLEALWIVKTDHQYTLFQYSFNTPSTHTLFVNTFITKISYLTLPWLGLCYWRDCRSFGTQSRVPGLRHITRTICQKTPHTRISTPTTITYPQH